MKAQFNKSEIFKAAHMATRTRSNGGSYKAAFSAFLKLAYKNAKCAAEVVVLVSLSIPYKHEYSRGIAKKQGFKWNAGAKLWQKEMKVSGLVDSLKAYVSKGNAAAKETSVDVNSGAGFFMVNTVGNWARVAKYGFDAIESGY